MISKSEQIRILSGRITESRYAKMLRALDFRTRKITVVLEDIFQPHNAAAVLRNCDAFGLQDVYFIENKYKLRISDNVDMGVSKWQDIYRFTSPIAKIQKTGMPKPKTQLAEESANTISALKAVKDKGYCLVASVLDSNAGTLEDIPVDKPIALMVGTELSGLSPVACDLADYKFTMQMCGFAQSFNLSVFTALCLSSLCKKLRNYDDSWKLSESEKEDLLLDWLKRSVANSDKILSEVL